MASLGFQTFLLLLSLMALPARSQTMASLFTVDPTCNQYNMDQYLQDALTMLSSAQTALSNMQSTRTFMGGSNARHYMRNARNTFGTSYYSATTMSGLQSNDTTQLNEVSANLQKIQNLLAGQQTSAIGPSLSPENAYLSCSDSPYTSTTNAQDIDPNLSAGTTVQEAFAMASAYYIPAPAGNIFRTANGAQRRVVATSPNKPDPICADGVYALTEPQDRFTPNAPAIQIILCPLFFSGLRGTINVSPAATDDITNYQFGASAFIHELFHLLGHIFSDTRFYAEGFNQPLNPYGARVIYALANRPDDFQSAGGSLSVVELPDAYRIFCDMCQFPKTKWMVVPFGGTTPVKRTIQRTVRPKTLDPWKLP